jgi:phosphatidylserine decarboxylase
MRMTAPATHQRSAPAFGPGAVVPIQPGGGWAIRLELLWGRARRKYLRLVRPGHVARALAARRGECPGCPHDVIDSRDLKLCANACGYWFPPATDPFAWRDTVPIARAGWAEVVLFGGGAAVATALALLVWPWAAVLPALAGVFVVAFFRDPPRRIPEGPGVVVSPADGRVTDVTPLDSVNDFGGPGVRIGIYLSLFNVHVNRCPVNGTAVWVRYAPGRFLDSRRPDAARVNESIETLFGSADGSGRLYLVRQVAGAFASRVVTTVRPGRRFPVGHKIGMIKFGSRTELYLSDPRVVVLVRPGDVVRGGASVLARQPEPGPGPPDGCEPARPLSPEGESS